MGWFVLVWVFVVVYVVFVLFVFSLCGVLGLWFDGFVCLLVLFCLTG